jgi:hypothetical protein
MINFQLWPPPNWTECVVSWDYILKTHEVHPQELYDWCNNHASTGRYHVHGWQSTEGFAFRFEDPRDAVLFKLTWKCE